MQTIRSFISVPLPPGITSAAAKMIKRLREYSDSMKWVPVDNMHLTLKFLGEVDNIEVHDICKAMRKVAVDIQPFELEFGGAGGLPGNDRARVIYMGVTDPSGSLTRLVNGLETALADLGYRPESRDYVPHLTLGRVRSNSRKAGTELVQALEETSATNVGEMVVDEIQLIGSFLDKQGPSYHVMDSLGLGEAETAD